MKRRPRAKKQSVAGDILEGMRNAVAYAKGNTAKARVHRVMVDDVDVRALRTKLRLSQGKFALTFGVSAKTVRKWEQGLRHPTGAARVLLKVIEQEPNAVRRALRAAE